MNPTLLTMAGEHRLVATIEDGIRVGGVGARLALELADNDLDAPVRVCGLPARFLDHGTRNDLLQGHGLSARHVADALIAVVTVTAVVTATRQGV